MSPAAMQTNQAVAYMIINNSVTNLIIMPNRHRMLRMPRHVIPFALSGIMLYV